MKNGSVLIVDDAEGNRLSAEAILVDAGYNVLLAAGGLEGLKLAREQEPYVILLDVMMPDIDGFETFRRLKKNDRTNKTKIIFLTAKTQVTDRVEALNLGGDDYVMKPYAPAELLARIGTQYRLAQAEREMDAVRQKEQDDLKFGAAVQRVMLTNAPNLQEVFAPLGVGVSFFNQPSGLVTGDWVYPKAISENSAGCFLADSCGHGLPAALLSVGILPFVGLLRSPFRTPSEFLMGLSLDIHGVFPIGRNVAATYVIFVRQGNRMQVHISNAGQPFPILIRTDGSVEEVEIEGFPLGQGTVDYRDIHLDFQINDRLILHTDGIIEAENAVAELYGPEKLLECIKQNKNLPLKDLEKSIIDDLSAFVGETPFEDDITLAIFERKPK